MRPWRQQLKHVTLHRGGGTTVVNKYIMRSVNHGKCFGDAHYGILQNILMQAEKRREREQTQALLLVKVNDNRTMNDMFNRAFGPLAETQMTRQSMGAKSSAIKRMRLNVTKPLRRVRKYIA